MKFAERAKQVQVKAKANVKKSAAELQRLFDQLRAEVASLKKQIAESGGVPVPDAGAEPTSPSTTAGDEDMHVAVQEL
jgi:hypothetical protein